MKREIIYNRARVMQKNIFRTQNEYEDNKTRFIDKYFLFIQRAKILKIWNDPVIIPMIRG